jgi:hypothetical protein
VFLRYSERLLSTSVLLDSVWGAEFLGDDNSVEVSVRQLRRALGEPELLHTVSNFERGVGPQVHCSLLSGSRVVAELRFDRRSGQWLEVRGPRAKPGPPAGRPGR